MVNYVFKTDAGIKTLSMASGEVVEAKNDSYEMLDIIEGIKALWRGSANYIPEGTHKSEIEVEGLGKRVITERSKVEGNLNVTNENTMFIECNINQVSIEIGVNDVEVDDKGRVKIKDKQENKGVLQALAFKKSINNVLKEYSIEGDIVKGAGEGNIKSELHLVDKNGRRVSKDELADENYMIVTLMLLLCQYQKSINVIFIDLGGVNEKELMGDLLKWVNRNGSVNRNNYILLYNNFRGLRIAKRRVKI